jgi:hypothetical protein
MDLFSPESEDRIVKQVLNLLSLPDSLANLKGNYVPVIDIINTAHV